MCWPFDAGSFRCGRMFGLGCSPCEHGCHLEERSIPVSAGGPAILSAQLTLASDAGSFERSDALSGISWLTAGDVLTLTLGAPVIGKPTADDFDVIVSNRGQLDECERDAVAVKPDFVTLSPADEANERKTIFIVGDFTRRQDDDYGYYTSTDSAPIAIRIKSLELQVYSWRHSLNDTLYRMSDCISDSCAPHFNLFSSPRLVDARHLDLSEPLNTASADTNGCAAMHPSATHAIRLTFSSGVFERNLDSNLVPYGTYDTPERASATFRLSTSPDRDSILCLQHEEVGPADAIGVCKLPESSSTAPSKGVRSAHEVSTSQRSTSAAGGSRSAAVGGRVPQHRRTIVKTSFEFSNNTGAPGHQEFSGLHAQTLAGTSTAWQPRTLSRIQAGDGTRNGAGDGAGGVEDDYDFSCVNPPDCTHCRRWTWEEPVSEAVVLGVADVDGDNIVDVCVQGPADATAVWFISADSGMVDSNGRPSLFFFMDYYSTRFFLYPPSNLELQDYCSENFRSPDYEPHDDSEYPHPGHPGNPSHRKFQTGELTGLIILAVIVVGLYVASVRWPRARRTAQPAPAAVARC